MTIEINIDGKPYGLTFGMVAIEEMQLRQLNRMQANDPVGNSRALTDMFYCAHNNFNDVQEPQQPRITYATASELIETLVYSSDTETQQRIVDSFQNCRATKHMQEQLEGIKKKAVKAQEKANQTI